MASDINFRRIFRQEQLLDEMRKLIRLYEGIDHGGVDSNGIVDVEFPSMIKAAAFIEVAHLQDDALPRDPQPKDALRTFGEPITIQFSLLAYAMCR